MKCKTRLLIVLFLFCQAYGLAQSYIVACYYPHFKKWTLPAENIQFENLTHIYHAFIYPDSSGNLIIPDDFIYPELVTNAHLADVKVIASLGGWGNSDAFVPMISDSAARKNFISNLGNFVQAYDYDGVDLDWEFPYSLTEGKLLTLFVKELREFFGDSILITMAVNSGNWIGQNFEYEKMKDYLDWMAIMAFEYHGSWSGHSGHNALLYQPPGDNDGSVYNSVQYFTVTRQIPKNKLLLGVPFYGKKFVTHGLYLPFTGSTQEMEYSNIAGLDESEWTYYWDDVSKVPFLQNADSTELITYDDTVSIGLKADFTIQNKLAGMMIWALGQDVVGDEQPLIGKIGEKMFGSPSLLISDDELPKSHKLFGNYPNPFNPSTKIKFYIGYESKATLKVYDILGRQIRVLVDGYLNPGTHEIEFNINELNGENENENFLSSSVYFVTLQAGDYTATTKMLLLK